MPQVRAPAPPPPSRAHSCPFRPLTHAPYPLPPQGSMTTAGETPPTTNKSWALAHLVAERGARSSSHQSPHPHIPCSTSRLAQPSRVLHRAPRTHAFDPHAQLHLQILFNPDCFARAQSDVGSSRLDDNAAPAPTPSLLAWRVVGRGTNYVYGNNKLSARVFCLYVLRVRRYM